MADDATLTYLLRQWEDAEPDACKYHRASYGIGKAGYQLRYQDYTYVATDGREPRGKLVPLVAGAVADAIEKRGWDWRKDATAALVIKPDGWHYQPAGCARLSDYDTFAGALMAAYLEALESEATPAPAAPAPAH